ncbi:MAG: VOC family protein [Fimbriimonadaceae bacterium]|nr:VOC family protein [Alphaproteobacteria bacterium]
MQFDGIQQIIYGVEDMATCRRFLVDWGLNPVSEFPAKATYETLDGSEVVIAPLEDPKLPAAIEPGPTLRQVTWGVKSKDDLGALEEKLRDVDGFKREKGLISWVDPNGLGLAFAVSSRRAVAVKASPFNDASNNARIDERSPVYDHGEPVRIGHVVFFTADIASTLKFYTDVLGFHVSDSYPGTGYFLRCKQQGGHHDMFILQTPAKNRGLNHVAFTVRDLNEVFGGGIHMNAKGWKTQIGPGRHPISSAYFWYVHNPCGGLAEYYTNEDYCTENWKPKEWERSNEHFAEWAVKGGIDQKTRRQVEG